MTKDATSVPYQMCCHPSVCVPFLNVYIQADWRTKRGVSSGLQAQRYAHEVPDTHPWLSDSRLLELAKPQQQVAWSEKQAVRQVMPTEKMHSLEAENCFIWGHS